MKAQEKIWRLRLYFKAVPFCRIGSLHITYKDVQLFDYTPNLFHGRLFYGQFYIGGSSPFYSISCLPARGTMRLHDPTLRFDDDVTGLYETAAERERQTVLFWQELVRQTERIRQLALCGCRDNLRRWRFRAALIDLRMWGGATWWLKWGQFLRVPDLDAVSETARRAQWAWRLLLDDVRWRDGV